MTQPPENFGGFVEVLLFEAEAGEDFLGLRFELIAVEVGELVLGLGEVRMRMVALGLVFAHGAEDADHFRGDAHGDLDDGFIGGLAGFLREVSGDGVFVALDGAFIGAVLIENHAEERGFPGTVGADEGDAFAPVDGHLGLAEQGAAAEGLGKLFDREHAGGLEEDRAWGKKFGRMQNLPWKIRSETPGCERGAAGISPKRRLSLGHTGFR
jgi:hypothetical protein